MKKKRSLHPDIIAYMTKYGVTVKKGQNLKPAKFNLADLKFRSLRFKDEDHQITGKEMRKRAIFRKSNLGLADAKNLLDQLNNHPDKRKDLHGKFIVLHRTLLRVSGDRRSHVACLYWQGFHWWFLFCSFDKGWDDYDLVACSEPACR